jgi:hypothetical protein
MGTYTNDFYKVYVTKDFPRVYEERVYFKNDDPSNEIAIIREGYHVDEVYSDYWVDEVVLKPGEWFWTTEEVEKDFERRRLELMSKKDREIERIEDEMAELRGTRFSESDIKPGEFCKNLPSGKQEQIDRHYKIEQNWKKKRLEEKLDRQRKEIEKLEAQMKDMELI